jgi:hypothetical protein
LTGAADQLRQDEQWQYPAAAASPSTLISTAPQKQLPLYDLAIVPLLEMCVEPLQLDRAANADQHSKRAVRRVTRRRVHTCASERLRRPVFASRLLPIVLARKSGEERLTARPALLSARPARLASNGRHLLAPLGTHARDATIETRRRTGPA